MTVVRIPQRSFASGELDPRFSGLVDSEQYRSGLRLGKGLFFSEFGTAQKRYGTVKIATTLEIEPAVFGVDIPSVGARVLLFSDTKIEIYDALARTVEDTLTWGSSEWNDRGNVKNAIVIAFSNQVWVLHPDEQTLILERDPLGNWSFALIRDKIGLLEPRIDPRPLTTTIAKSTNDLTAGSKYFTPEDADGSGSLWFIGTDDGSQTKTSGWVRASNYLSPTILRHSAVGDTLPTDGITSDDWAGPWKVDGTFPNTITLSGTLTVQGDFTATLTGGDAAVATDVGSVISFQQNVRLLAVIRKVTSGTAVECRVIDANGGSLAASYTGAHNIWRPKFREYDGNFLMLEHESNAGARLFSFTPMMNSLMVAGSDDRDARFDIGNGRQLARVDTFLGTQNVTIQHITKDWVATDLAPRMNFSPLMSNYHGWPGTGTIHQGRMLLGGFEMAPLNVVGSRTFQPLNFQSGAEDDDGFVFQIELAVGIISWMVSGQDLLVGTTLSEYALRGSPLTPSNVKAELQTTYGGFRDRAVRVAGAAVFVTRCGCGLREMAFRFETDRFSAPDLTDLNQLWDTFPAAQVILRQPSYVREPNPLILTIGNAQQLTCLTYRRDNGVIAWSPWQFTLKIGQAEANRDKVTSLATVATTTQRDETWISTRRFVNVAFADFVEVISDEAIFDCQTTITSPGSTTISGLNDYEGRRVAVVADGVWLGYYTVASNAIDLSNHLGGPPTTVILGYEIPCEIEPQVQQIDDLSGGSDGRRRTIKNVHLVLVDSYGGEIGHFPATESGTPVEQFNPIFADVVEGTTLSTVTFSGVKQVGVSMGGEDARPRIRALGPWKFQLSAVNISVDIGD